MTSDFKKLLRASLGSPKSEVRSPRPLEVLSPMSEVLPPCKSNPVKGIAP